jgi:hypothetical protein
LRPPFGLTITPATYWGVVGVIGLLVPRRWCQNDAQQNRPEHRNPTESDRPTLPLFFFSFRDFLRLSGLILEEKIIVFLSSPCRETAKNAIKIIAGKKRQQKSFVSNLFGKKLLRNAQKHHKKMEN